MRWCFVVALERGVSGYGRISGAADHPAHGLTYTQAELRAHPRQPLPRTSPQSWINSEDYPQAALLNDMEGVLRFRVGVDAYGEVVECTITLSSGVAAFDSRACATVMTRARFYPALDKDQRPVSGQYNSTVRWVMED